MGRAGFLGSLCGVLLCGLGLLAAPPALAATIQIVPGTTLQMNVPAGQCMLEPQLNQFDAAYWSSMQQVFAGQYNILAYFLPCEGLASLRMGIAYPMDDLTALLLPLSNGQIFSPQGYTRSQVFDELSRLAAASDTPVARQALEATGQRSLGVLGRDNDGIFNAVMMTQMIGGQAQQVAGLFGTTLINGYVVSIHRQRLYRGPQDVQAMLAAMQLQIADLVRMNEQQTSIAAAPVPAPLAAIAPPGPQDTDAATPDSDGSRLLLMIGAGVVVIVVGGGLGLFLSRRKAGGA